MKTEFIQKRGINSRKFILTNDKIIVETKNIKKNNKYELKLDQLGFNIHYQSDNTLVGKIFLGICIAIIVAVSVEYFVGHSVDIVALVINYIVWSLLGCLAYFKQHQDDVFLVGGASNLVLYRNFPNEAAVLEFIEKIRTQTKIYLKEKYTFFDDTTNEQDFYARIKWLKDREVISNNEYLAYKSDFDTHKLLNSL